MLSSKMVFSVFVTNIPWGALNRSIASFNCPPSLLKPTSTGIILPENWFFIRKSTFFSFAVSYSRVSCICEVRATKLSAQLRKLAALFDKNFDKVTREDIMELLAKLNTENNTDRVLRHYYTGKIFHIRGKPMTYNTRKDYLRIVKAFFRWLKGKNTLLVDDIKAVRKESERFTNIGDIITDEDMLLILEKCESLRDRALLALLHETGARAACILNLRRKDIFREGKLTKVRLNGKTGERKIIIVSYSIPT